MALQLVAAIPVGSPGRFEHPALTRNPVLSCPQPLRNRRTSAQAPCRKQRSNAIPYPDRITKLGRGLHAIPTRGAIALALFRSYQRSVFRKVTSPAPTIGLSGT